MTDEVFDPHEWYFVVQCGECQGFIPLGEAPPITAQVEPRFVELRVLCPSCGHERGYQPKEISRQLQRARKLHSIKSQFFPPR
jgi:hypothetical protein